MDDAQRIQEQVERAINFLDEHCDSVLIVTTFSGNHRTLTHHATRGNFYASVGAAEEWLESVRYTPPEVEEASE